MVHATRIWLCPSILRLLRSWSWVGFQTNVYLLRERACANIQRSLWSLLDHVSLNQFSQFIFLFLLYKLFFVSQSESFELDLSFSRHCTRRKKRLRPKETRKIFHRGGFWIMQSMESHSHYYFVTMLVFNICSCSIFLLFWRRGGAMYMSLFVFIFLAFLLVLWNMIKCG